MAAAVEGGCSAAVASSETILQEVRKFLKGATSDRQVEKESLANSALYLLQTLPTARYAVLEHLCYVFDEAVNEHIMKLMFNNESSNSEENRGHLGNIIQDACGVLFNFIKTNPQAWAPIISAWSLRLLGQISQKYAGHRVVPHPGSLNELLQLWMTCPPTKSLMEVATECFGAMIGGGPDSCVDALLEASVNYSPHFDWVVAHIGSCFPETIITRVLLCGLKDYCHLGNKATEVEIMAEEKIPKMASVVGILGHLASKHSQDIRMALMRLFEESLHTNSDAVKVTTVPFLLQLASMSNMLLQALTTDLVMALTPSVVNKLSCQFSAYKLSSPHEYESFLSLVVHLVTLTDVGSYEVLQFLLSTADTPTDETGEAPNAEVRTTCGTLLNRLVTELQRAVFHRHRDGLSEVPFLASLTPRSIDITELLLHSSAIKADCLVKLLSFVGLYSGEDCAAEILAYIITEAKDREQLQRFIQLQMVTEIRLRDILERTTQKIMSYLQPPIVYCPQRLLNNILTVLQSEGKSSKIRCTLIHYIKLKCESLIPLLSHSDLMVAMTTLKILNIVGLTEPFSTGSSLSVCSAIVIVFFRALELVDARESQKIVMVCRQYMKQLCKFSYIQCVLLRFLIEGIVTKELAFLFGAKVNHADLIEKRSSKVSLFEENSSHGLTLTIPRSHSSVFHAGIIGSGLRSRSLTSALKKDHIIRNRRCMLGVLCSCSQQHQPTHSEVAMETEGYHPEHASIKRSVLKMSHDLCRMIGSLITELTTPDVLYNNRFWPEEDSIRITVERDLFVWKNFDENPMLWDLIELYSGNSLAICRCSPVLKSIAASLMNHFECSRENLSRNTPKHLEAACRLVGCLSKSLLLPEPLKYVSELLPLVTSYEAYLLLLTVWRYMKENPPTEDPEEVRRRVCESRHVEIIRAILHSNIDKMGHLYSRFFSSATS